MWCKNAYGVTMVPPYILYMHVWSNVVGWVVLSIRPCTTTKYLPLVPLQSPGAPLQSNGVPIQPNGVPYQSTGVSLQSPAGFVLQLAISTTYNMPQFELLISCDLSMNQQVGCVISFIVWSADCLAPALWDKYGF